MKPPKVAVRRLAELEANQAVLWYEERQAGLGREFLDEFRAALRKIAARPLSFPVDYRDARRALLRRFPYKVYFVIQGSGVVVIGVLHSRQSTARLRGRL